MSNDYGEKTIVDNPVNDPVAFIVDDGKVKHINYISNIVDQKTLRRIQSTILGDLTKILINSFGPHGSVTAIKNLNASTMYTKDGHTILGAIKYNGIIEQSIRDDIENITLNIVKTVGDGTTSAVILSKLIFDSIIKGIEANPNLYASDVTRAMDKIGKEIDEAIRETAKECNLQDIFDIAYTSSDGDYWVAQFIQNIYKESGMGVFIDVAPTTAPEEITVKTFDGMTIDSGFMDSSFVTNPSDNSAVVDNPEIYFFDDPIDTKELGVILDAILSNNIIDPFDTGVRTGVFNLTPTVIVCPKISRDMSSLIDRLVDIQSKQPAGNKLPVNFVINRTQPDQIRDIYQLCGAKPIMKYMDAEVYKADVEAGRACTPDNFFDFAGKAESVVSYSEDTKFINPLEMKNEDGEFSEIYKNLLAFVEAEIKKNEADGGDVRELGTLKRRLHALKSNLVEIRVGGMSPSDRDALLHRVEDAVKNCRSAAKYGVGWGANVSGLNAIIDLNDEIGSAGATDAEYLVVNGIFDAYIELVNMLYATKYPNSRELVDQTIRGGGPYNMRTNEFDGKVKSSIESDTIILNSVMKIVGLMISCNQFMVPTAQHNVYTDTKEIK